MDKVINKYKILNELKLDKDFIQKIKLIYVFRNDFKGSNVIIATKEDKIYAFGSNGGGALGFGHQNNMFKLTVNEKLSHKRIIDFKNSALHVIASTADGKVYCWGRNEYGILGIGRNSEKTYKPELNQYLNDIIDICCGYLHSLALTIDGEVYAWGYNKDGQIGNGKNSEYESQLMPYHVKGFDGQKVKAISCGSWHSMALTDRGNVFSWGYNNFGQLGIGSVESCNSPKLITLKMTIQKISCGRSHSLLLSSDEEIHVFGSNNRKQLGTEVENKKQLTPKKLAHSNKFIDISSHFLNDISSALSKSGLFFVWGKCGEEVVSKPKETNLKSFNDFFANYLKITHGTISYAPQKHDIISKINLLESDKLHHLSEAIIHLPNKRIHDENEKNDLSITQLISAFPMRPGLIAPAIQKKIKLDNIENKSVVQQSRYKNNFKELGVIGVGGFGKVYKALNLFDGQCYAVKKVELKG